MTAFMLVMLLAAANGDTTQVFLEGFPEKHQCQGVAAWIKEQPFIEDVDGTIYKVVGLSCEREKAA